MPHERTPPPEILITPEITITPEPTCTTEQLHQLPVSAPPTPAPAPSATPNSLELHIPIPIPTPPTPLPIVVAYPLSQGLVTPASEHAPEYIQGQLQRARRDTMETDDSGIELEPVPAPVKLQKPAIEYGAESREVQRERLETTALEREFELLEMTDEERMDAQTVYLFRALNVPVNIHRLRAMRAKGRLPAPFLKFRHGYTHAKPTRASIPSGSGKENKEVHLTGILKVPSSTDPESPTEMETMQGESWYLPSADVRRMTRQRSFRGDFEIEESNWESPRAREFRHEELYAPQPVIPNHTLLDNFPLPPSFLPSVAAQHEQYSVPSPPNPSPTPSPSGRPLGYMYAPPKSLRRSPSYNSCGSSPINSVGGPRTLTPAALPAQSPATGCYYAYDLLTPSPGALPYSAYGSRSISSKHSTSVRATPLPSPLPRQYIF